MRVRASSWAASFRKALFIALSIGVVGSAVWSREDTANRFEISEEGKRALALTGDPVEGARSYQSCVACHLESGAGSADGIFPQLAGQHKTVIVKQLTDIRAGERVNPIMAPFAEALIDAREIADVAAHIESLPVPGDNGKGSGEAIDLGARLYMRDCATCHGSRGEGDAANFRPVLAGQHYAYLLRQARAIAADRRGNSDPRMKVLVASYDDAELRAVLDYLSRLDWPKRRSVSLGD